MEGMPFRKAHEVVGKAVVFAEKQKLQLFQLDIKDLQKFSKLIKSDVYSFLDPEKTIYTRNMIGGTSPKQVIRQVKKAKIKLKSRK
jgi:argininosuccinate lyase